MRWTFYYQQGEWYGTCVPEYNLNERYTTHGHDTIEEVTAAIDAHTYYIEYV